MQRENKEDRKSELGRKNSGHESIDVEYEVQKFESEKDIARRAQ